MGMLPKVFFTILMIAVAGATAGCDTRGCCGDSNKSASAGTTGGGGGTSGGGGAGAPAPALPAPGGTVTMSDSTGVVTVTGMNRGVIHGPYLAGQDQYTIWDGLRKGPSEKGASRPFVAGGYSGSPGWGIGAIVPMHTLGHPMRIAELVALAEEYGVPVVEDAAESLGSRADGVHTGTFGRLGIISFNGNKILTTGGGGMILTDDDELARRARHLTTTAKLPHRWEFEHDEVAYNYRMPNLNAALGVAQLERLPEFLADKRRLAARYQAAFAEAPDVEFLSEPAGTESNYWLCAVRVTGTAAHRDALLEATNDAGLQCRPFWNLLHAQAPYRHLPHAPVPVAEALHASVVCIPSSPALAAA